MRSPQITDFQVVVVVVVAGAGEHCSDVTKWKLTPANYKAGPCGACRLLRNQLCKWKELGRASAELEQVQ